MHYLYVTFGARGMLQNCTPYIVCKIIWISFLYISVWYIYCTTKMNGISLELFAATEFSEIFVRQTAASRCEGFPTFGGGLTLSPTSGCAGGLVEPELMAKCPTLHCVYLRC